MSYAWDYMARTEPRGKRLYDIIEPFIINCTTVVEMNCGFAPLYPYLRTRSYTGFDSNSECISFLQEAHPEGNWLVCNDQDFPVKPYDLVLLLGAVGGKHPDDSPTQWDTFAKLAALSKVAIIEHSWRVKAPGTLIARYDADFSNHHRKREVRLYVK